MSLSLQQTKVYHHSCYNAHEAEVKLIKAQEKVETARNATQRKKALGKETEVMAGRVYLAVI